MQPKRIAFIVIFAVVVIGGAFLLIRRERKGPGRMWAEILTWIVALLLLGWLGYFIVTGSLNVPLMGTGFRMVVFSVVIMIVVLFFRQGIMGDKEFTDLILRRKKAIGKEGAK